MEKARRLQPDSGPVHLALAHHALQISNNVEEAGVQAQLARRALPGDAQVEAVAGRVARRQDRWDDAVGCLEKAVSLEPRDVKLRFLLASTYRYMRRYSEYDQNMERVLALTPSDKQNTIPIERAMGHLESSADLVPLREAITRQTAAHQIDDSDVATTAMILAVWSHDHAAITHILSSKHDLLGWNGVVYPDAWFEALAARIRGDNKAAVQACAAARPVMEKRVTADQTDGLQMSALAMIDAGLGHNADAVQEGKKACELISKANSFYAANVHCHLAVVYAWTGQNDLAIAELTPLIDRPAVGGFICFPTYGDFRLNPLWDPLRNDARFDALVQRLAPTATK
jgi:tetratricopeptide (TPR) repeat protein